MDRPNICVTDNKGLAQWLLENFQRHFGAYRNIRPLQTIPIVDAAEFTHRWEDGNGTYVEEAATQDLRLTLKWSDLGERFLVDVPPEQSATGIHEMISLFVLCKSAQIEINGKRVPGEPMERDFWGRPGVTAFLAFSETWLGQP